MGELVLMKGGKMENREKAIPQTHAHNEAETVFFEPGVNWSEASVLNCTIPAPQFYTIPEYTNSFFTLAGSTFN